MISTSKVLDVDSAEFAAGKEIQTCFLRLFVRRKPLICLDGRFIIFIHVIYVAVVVFYIILVVISRHNGNPLASARPDAHQSRKVSQSYS
jgi:hypothetical protein